MNKIAVFLMFTFLLSVSIVGTTRAGVNAKTGEEIKMAKKGTYIFIFQSSSLDPIPIDGPLLKKIEENRHETEIVYLTIKPGVAVKILSRAEITTSEFVYLTQEYIIDPVFFKNQTNKK